MTYILVIMTDYFSFSSGFQTWQEKCKTRPNINNWKDPKAMQRIWKTLKAIIKAKTWVYKLQDSIYTIFRKEETNCFATQDNEGPSVKLDTQCLDGTNSISSSSSSLFCPVSLIFCKTSSRRHKWRIVFPVYRVPSCLEQWIHSDGLFWFF